MRLANEIYWAYVQELGVTAVGNILIPIDGVYMSIEDVPSAYVEEVFGYTKAEFLAMIAVEVESSILEESLNDI